jgi:hypothetical protein
LGGYIAGERIVGIITRWIVLGDEARCKARWARNFVKGGADGLSSLKSRLGTFCAETKWSCVVDGRVRRLLRSNS